jgi:thiol-disulfide isomerase/thioredoxin
MIRVTSRAAILMGTLAILAIAVGLGVWFISPRRAPAPGAQSTQQSAPAGFSFTPWEQPRPLSELHFKNADGEALNIANFRGRIVLLNLWATWCGPCRKEMPTLDRLQAKFGGSEFEVVAISIDRQGLPAVKSFYEKLGLTTLRIYLDPSGKVVFDLGAFGIPTTLLIDREGRELGRVAGAVRWDSPEVEAVIRRYLNSKATAIPGPDAFSTDLHVRLAGARLPGELPSSPGELKNSTRTYAGLLHEYTRNDETD